jgi:hypothetical protein
MRLVDRFPEESFGFAGTRGTSKQPVSGAAAMELLLSRKRPVKIAEALSF